MGPVAPGVCGVQQDDEGLPQLLQLPDHPLLRFQVVLPGDVGDGAVGSDDNADGGVLGDHLPGADLRRLRHGDLVIEPRGGHHPLGLSFQMSHRSLHHVAHAVDEPDLEGGAPLHCDSYRFLRDKFGLRRHDGTPGAALGQFIPGPLPAVHIFNVGDDQRLHEPLDKCGFSGPDRPHDADIDIALGPKRDILVDFAIFH